MEAYSVLNKCYRSYDVNDGFLLATSLENDRSFIFDLKTKTLVQKLIKRKYIKLIDINQLLLLGDSDVELYKNEQNLSNGILRFNNHSYYVFSKELDLIITDLCLNQICSINLEELGFTAVIKSCLIIESNIVVLLAPDHNSIKRRPHVLMSFGLKNGLLSLNWSFDISSYVDQNNLQKISFCSITFTNADVILSITSGIMMKGPSYVVKNVNTGLTVFEESGLKDRKEYVPTYIDLTDNRNYDFRFVHHISGSVFFDFSNQKIVRLDLSHYSSLGLKNLEFQIKHIDEEFIYVRFAKDDCLCILQRSNISKYLVFEVDISGHLNYPILKIKTDKDFVVTYDQTNTIKVFSKEEIRKELTEKYSLT